MELTTILLLILNLSIIFLLIFLLSKTKKKNDSDILDKFSLLLKENSQQNDKLLRDEFARNRDEFNKNSKDSREELSKSLNMFSDNLLKRMSEIAQMQKAQLDTFAQQLTNLTATNEDKFEKLQTKVSDQLKEIQENNSKKLEEMRVTVDEKLHETLEKRLGESFKLVSDRLELVHKGLGEMQTLATGVGDLKKVLTNVKTRGTWGEIQLENLIDQILAPDQYEKNVQTKKGSQARVEFAIKLPGRNEIKDEVVWMPIDAKFPLEDYQRLMEAQEKGDIPAIEEAGKLIERRIKDEAKSISSKYLDPPNTTDFAIMFLPIEGLYAEVLRRVGLADTIQHDFRIIIAGPTNIAALLNSLQMGFRTLAIEKRSSEVWKLLAVVKTEFGKFGDLLDKTHTKLEQASKSIGEATRKTRTIERKLRDVQELPSSEQTDLLDE
ncbi:MAG: DNA recombination protein RmuC [Melioribacteraceae bacterium]|nr:DNA recombination protein RmuC [Melioribacteraceae bacterium]